MPRQHRATVRNFEDRDDLEFSAGAARHARSARERHAAVRDLDQPPAVAGELVGPAHAERIPGVIVDAAAAGPSALAVRVHDAAVGVDMGVVPAIELRGPAGPGAGDAAAPAGRPGVGMPFAAAFSAAFPATLSAAFL